MLHKWDDSFSDRPREEDKRDEYGLVRVGK